MPLIYRVFCLLALVPAAIAPVARGAELSTTGVLLDGIAAVVNDGIVLRSDVEEQVQLISRRIEEQGQQLPPRSILRQQVLERQVMQELQLQRAERGGIQVSDEMLNQALTDVAQRNGIKFSDLPEALEQQGVDYRAYRDDVRRDMTLSMLRQRDVIARIYISPREVEQCVAKRKESPGQDNEYSLGHILVAIPASASPEQIAERDARARGVYERARSGEDFAQLAISYSDAGTALEGGSLGWRRVSQLPSFVADLIPRMQPGDVTEPIRTPSGLHIFKLLEQRGGDSSQMVSQVHARHILMKTNELEDDGTIERKLADIRAQVLEGQDFAAIASVTSEDTGSAAVGGDLGWTSPGSFVPEFEGQLNALAEGEISAPFKTQYGWHIVQLLGRRTYDATDDVLRNRCVAQLREAKTDEETEIWLRRLRDEAFVEYRM